VNASFAAPTAARTASSAAPIGSTVVSVGSVDVGGGGVLLVLVVGSVDAETSGSVVGAVLVDAGAGLVDEVATVASA
jgi:hypothetical protein